METLSQHAESSSHDPGAPLTTDGRCSGLGSLKVNEQRTLYRGNSSTLTSSNIRSRIKQNKVKKSKKLTHLYSNWSLTVAKCRHRGEDRGRIRRWERDPHRRRSGSTIAPLTANVCHHQAESNNHEKQENNRYDKFHKLLPKLSHRMLGTHL